jgi:CRISPR/Cas system-associated endoribonuclease Cas2
MGNKKSNMKNLKIKSQFFEKIKKAKLLAKLTKRQRDSIQINKIKNEKGDNKRQRGNSKNH